MKLNRILIALILAGAANHAGAQDTPAEPPVAPETEVAPAEPDAPEIVAPEPDDDIAPSTEVEVEIYDENGAIVEETEAEAEGEGKEEEVAEEPATPTLDPDADPNYGSVDLAVGFTPDPHSLALLSGGDIDASTIEGGYCYGYIDDAPDYRVNYQAGDVPLYFTATSAEDTVLVIRGPSGGWFCDDDSAGNLNPRVTFDVPESGSYDVWVGTYGAANFFDATLEVSELTPEDPWADDTYGGYSTSTVAVSGELNLRAGFKPDPIRLPVLAGGPNDAYVYDTRCLGYISELPTFRLNYTAGALPLTITSMSVTDTTLVVRDSSGVYHCDDDSAGNLDARITIERTYDGPIDIWIGTYDTSVTSDAILVITELE